MPKEPRTARSSRSPIPGAQSRSFHPASVDASVHGAASFDPLVLDLGAGPCLDSAELRSLGLRVISVDRSRRMLIAAHQEIPGPRVQADMRQLTFRPNCIAGVWACASLLHLDRDELVPALSGIRNVLVSSGVLFVSLKTAAARPGTHRSSGRKLRAGSRIGRMMTWTHRWGRLASRSSSRRLKRVYGTNGSLGSLVAVVNHSERRCG